MTSRVTVIMPTFNAGDYLRLSVESILAQSCVDFELLVMDDGSTDGSVEALAADVTDPRLRIVRQENAGKPAAVNRAMEMAVGEWIAIQDADDLANEKRLEILLGRVEAQPELGAVFSGYDLLVNGRQVAPIIREKDSEACRIDIENFAMPSHDPTIMFRRELGLRLKYDEELRIGEGHDFILRLGEITPMAVVAANLYSYRIAWSSLTRNDPHARERYVARVLQKACLRRGVEFSHQFPHMAGGDKHQVLADNGMHRHFVDSVMSSRERGDRLSAWKVATQSVSFQPFSARYYRPLAFAALPLPIIQRIRGSRKKKRDR